MGWAGKSGQERKLATNVAEVTISRERKLELARAEKKLAGCRIGEQDTHLSVPMLPPSQLQSMKD